MSFIVLSPFEWLFDSAIYDVQKVVTSFDFELLTMPGSGGDCVWLFPHKFTLGEVTTT